MFWIILKVSNEKAAGLILMNVYVWMLSLTTIYPLGCERGVGGAGDETFFFILNFRLDRKCIRYDY